MSSVNISQGVDFVDVLRTQLQGLGGWRSLTYELLQNADDAGAKSVEFLFEADALTVRNSATFTDCGHADGRDRTCPWLRTKKHECDFHRMRNVASGGKRRQEDNIGAFGVGFLSVYHITDTPMVASGRRRWEFRPLNPEESRINENPLNPPLDYTEIRLPWARDAASEARERLQLQAVSDEDVASFLSELQECLPDALIFLPNVTQLSVSTNGERHLDVAKRTERDGASERVVVRCGDSERCWRVYSGTFDERADSLRAEYNVAGERIEHNRGAQVQIAIPEAASQRDTGRDGLLFAYLPTETRTGLAFHVNASFYPDAERKHILLSGDYRCEWNLAALACAAWAGGRGCAATGRGRSAARRPCCRPPPARGGP